MGPTAAAPTPRLAIPSIWARAWRALEQIYGTRILISETTCRVAQDHIETRELDLIRVQGKSQAIRIYELTGMKNAVPEQQKAAHGLFGDGVRLYRARRFRRGAGFVRDR